METRFTLLTPSYLQNKCEWEYADVYLRIENDERDGPGREHRNNDREKRDGVERDDQTFERRVARLRQVAKLLAVRQKWLQVKRIPCHKESLLIKAFAILINAL